MDLERMFDDLFTTYSSLDPPPIKRKTEDLTKLDLKETYPNLYSYNTIIEPTDNINNTDITWNLEQKDQLSFQPDKPQFSAIKERTSEKQKNSNNLKGSQGFEKAFNEALKINPNISKYKNFLVKTAKRESGFNSKIQNSAGAPYYGYFQMGKNEIAITTKMTVEQFRNDPVAQILGACKLYEMNLKTIKKIGIYNIGKERGYSDDALVAGAWMGGPGGVKKYLLGLGDPSDSHWYKGGKGGSSVGKIINNWKANE